ncbi:MAG: SurA N-terminal domain-containing protein [Kiloniellaceae bacterium]
MNLRKLVIKIVTGILFGLLILSFAIWGIGDMFRGGTNAQAVAEVGDTIIEQRQFSRELSNEINAMSRRLGVQLTMDQARAFGIPQQVLERMITRAMLDEMASRMGMLVTEEQMRQHLLSNPDFQGAGGRFDRNRFTQTLYYSGLSEQAYLAQVGGDVMRQQLVAAVTDAAAAPRSLTERLFSYREERRVADYLSIAHDSITDLGTPEAAALQEIYAAAGNALMTPAYKDIVLVVLSMEAASAGIAVSEQQIAEAFEARRDELSTPERRRLRQVVLADEAAAQALADRLSEGADFAAAVQQETGRTPVDLGAVTQADLPEALGAAVFALQQGQATQPVQSPLGWHVATVDAIEPGVEASLEDSRADLRRRLARDAAVDVVIDLANRFDQMTAGGTSIEDAAERLNVQARRIPAIDAQGRAPDGELVEGLPSINEFLPLLRRTAVGDTSVLTETLDGDYFVLRVDGETPAVKRPLAEVRDQVTEMWRERERARHAEERANDLAARVARGDGLAAVAEAEGLELRRTEAITRFENNPQRTPSPQLSQQIFEIAEGEVTTVETGNAHIVARLAEILPPAEDGREARLGRLESDLTASLQNDIFQQFLAALQQDFRVTINESLVQQTLANF